MKATLITLIVFLVGAGFLFLIDKVTSDQRECHTCEITTTDGETIRYKGNCYAPTNATHIYGIPLIRIKEFKTINNCK